MLRDRISLVGCLAVGCLAPVASPSVASSSDDDAEIESRPKKRQRGMESAR